MLQKKNLNIWNSATLLLPQRVKSSLLLHVRYDTRNNFSLALVMQNNQQELFVIDRNDTMTGGGLTNLSLVHF